jgi:hypothetical protein
MQTTRKNVRDYLRLVGWILLFLFLAVSTLFIIPANILVYVTWFVGDYKLEVGLIVIGIFLAFLVYKNHRFIKLTGNPWQIEKGNLKKNLLLISSIPFIIYGCMALHAILFPIEYGRCDHYNEKLNGGVKEFKGKKFKVHLCGTGGYEGRFNYEPDEIRLQVFNEKGSLVALRHFEVDWRMGSQMVLEYHADHITYYDFSAKNFEKNILIPPTFIDWIRARIPLLD